MTIVTIETLRVLPQNILKETFFQWVGERTRAFNKTYLARKIVEAMESKAIDGDAAGSLTKHMMFPAEYIPSSHQLNAAPERTRRANKRIKSTNVIVALGYTLESGSVTQILRVNADNPVTKRVMKQLAAGDESVIGRISSCCRDRQRQELGLVLHWLTDAGFTSLQDAIDWAARNSVN